MRFTKRDVILSEAKYSVDAISVAFGKPKTPRRAGIVKRCLYRSLIAVFPVMAGSRQYLMAFSSDCRNLLILGIAQMMKDHLMRKGSKRSLWMSDTNMWKMFNFFNPLFNFLFHITFDKGVTVDCSPEMSPTFRSDIHIWAIEDIFGFGEMFWFHNKPSYFGILKVSIGRTQWNNLIPPFSEAFEISLSRGIPNLFPKAYMGIAKKSHWMVPSREKILSPSINTSIYSPYLLIKMVANWGHKPGCS